VFIVFVPVFIVARIILTPTPTGNTVANTHPPYACGSRNGGGGAQCILLRRKCIAFLRVGNAIASTDFLECLVTHGIHNKSMC
jgi:hypothetical protein